MKKFQVKILGITQDGGYPHAGCQKDCCLNLWDSTQKKELIASIAIIDHSSKNFWLIDITPDFKNQFNMISSNYSLSGIFLTHAHLGHYIGLLELGKEVMNLNDIPVYSMPRMKSFIENNSPINFLIENNNIRSLGLSSGKLVMLNRQISVIPFLVPHRNELSETVGYKIKSKNKNIIYLPDIDSWDNMDEDIMDLILDNDVLFIDGTFYDNNELLNRDMSKIPHPTIKDSFKKFKFLDKNERKKIFFTHLNHTNNLLRQDSKEFNEVLMNGYNIAKTNQSIDL